jgi:hypothetical protein
MYQLTTTDTIAIIAFVVTSVLLLARTVFSRSLPLPPGPPAKLWSGNAHQVPKEHPWLTYQTWAKKYGPILHFRIYSVPYIILSSAKATSALLEHRAQIYSDRPQATFTAKILARDRTMFGMQYDNPRFKVYHRLLSDGLNTRVTRASYKAIQEEERSTFLRLLDERPQEWTAHTRR